MKIQSPLACLLFSTLVLTSLSSAQTIINGSFDSIYPSGGSTNEFTSVYGGTITPSSDRDGDGTPDGLPGWTIQRNVSPAPTSDYPLVQNVPWTPYASKGPIVGSNMLTVYERNIHNGDQIEVSIEQNITGLSIGQVYEISFWDAGLADRNNPAVFFPIAMVNVYIDSTLAYMDNVLTHANSPHDVSATLGEPPGTTSFTNYAWEQQSFTFTASALQQTLKFVTVIQGQPVEISLDGIAIRAVPEPSTVMFSLLALTGVVCGRRRPKGWNSRLS